MNSADPIEGFMRQMAAPETCTAVPSAGTIWWRAEFRRRVALEERATRPMRIAERFACALCVAAAAVMAGELGGMAAFHFLIR